MKVYTAGPMTGLTFAEAAAHFERRAEVLRGYGYEVFHPFTGKGYLRDVEGPLKATNVNGRLSGDHAIIERDRWMVKQADVVYADLSGAQRVSIGTMFELAWAHDQGKHTVVVMEPGNIHEHAFVKEAADVVF